MKWPKVELGTFADAGEMELQTGPFGTQLRASDYTEDGTPVINVRNIGYGDLRPDKLEFVPDAVVTRLGKHLLKQNDIVFGRKGAVDRHLLVSDSEAGWMQGSDCLRLRLSSKRLSTGYLSYALRLNHHRQWMLNQCGNKATMASLNQDVVNRIPISLPPLQIQTAIVDIISSYDNLIENNRRRIELLEQSARLLYKEWFVHLRFPGHEHTTITNGIPEGWNKRQLGDIALTNVSSHKKSKLPEELNYIDIGSVREGRVLSRTRMLASEAPGRARRIANHGDVIWSNVRPNLKAYSLVLHPEENDVFSTGFTVLQSNGVPFTFLYNVTTTSDFVGHLVNHATGAGYPAVRPDDFERATVLAPSRKLLDLFHQVTEPIYEQQHILSGESSKLAQARDLLLPRLMNGEIAV